MWGEGLLLVDSRGLSNDWQMSIARAERRREGN